MWWSPLSSLGHGGLVVDLLCRLGLLSAPGDSVTVADIQGPAWRSPYAGQTVHDLVGTVTAQGPYGIWIAGDDVPDPRVSTGLYIYSYALGTKSNPTSSLSKPSVGDRISLSGTVTSFRQASAPNDLFLTELTDPSHLRILSSGHATPPLVLGPNGTRVLGPDGTTTRSPPTQYLSALDAPDWLALPGNQTLLSAHAHDLLLPHAFGLDFWASLQGRLVTVRAPVAVSYPNWFGDFWVRGDWAATGENARGGLTMTFGEDGMPDANPEAILIGKPLDNSRKPPVSSGTSLSDITGIIHYQFGSWTLLPLTSPHVLTVPPYNPPPSSLSASDDASGCTLIIGDYNVENMSPRSAHLPTIAAHIVNYMRAPSILLLQEIQDDSGSRNDGTVSANVTLGKLVDAIKTASDGAAEYAFIDVPPEDGKDGGQPGGNIRVAYLYKPSDVFLVPGAHTGAPTDANEAFLDANGSLALRYNPGRIAPSAPAWEDARKPLAALWEARAGGARLLTANVHFSSKRGSSGAHGDARPPVNGAAERRRAQMNVTAAFVRQALELEPGMAVVVGGDMNEFVHARDVFAPFGEGELLFDVDEVAGVPPVERYTYAWDQNTQMLDHIFVSRALKERGAEVEHIHVNTWAPLKRRQASDHDPTVAKVRIC